MENVIASLVGDTIAGVAALVAGMPVLWNQTAGAGPSLVLIIGKEQLAEPYRMR